MKSKKNRKVHIWWNGTKKFLTWNLHTLSRSVVLVEVWKFLFDTSVCTCSPHGSAVQARHSLQTNVTKFM